MMAEIIKIFFHFLKIAPMIEAISGAAAMVTDKTFRVSWIQYLLKFAIRAKKANEKVMEKMIPVRSDFRKTSREKCSLKFFIFVFLGCWFQVGLCLICVEPAPGRRKAMPHKRSHIPVSKKSAWSSIYCMAIGWWWQEWWGPFSIFWKSRSWLKPLAGQRR